MDTPTLVQIDVTWRIFVYPGNVTGMFPGSQNTHHFHGLLSVERKTVKFDIIVHLRDSTFTPAAMQSPTTYKFKEIPTII